MARLISYLKIGKLMLVPFLPTPTTLLGHRFATATCLKVCHLDSWTIISDKKQKRGVLKLIVIVQRNW